MRPISPETRDREFRLAWQTRRLNTTAASGGHNHGGRNIAKTRINRRRQSGRQTGIQYAFEAKAELRDNTSRRINNRGNAGVSCANQRQAFLDGAQARLLQMLIGAGRDSEPAVIGQVNDPAGAIVARRNIAGKNRLVANQR